MHHSHTYIRTYRYILVIQNNTMDNRIEKCPQHTHVDSMFQRHQSICSGLTEGKHCTTPSTREGGREICNLGIVLPATCTETRNDQNTQAAPLNTHATPTITMPAARVQFPGAYFLSNSYVNRQKNTSPGTCHTACSTSPHSMHMHHTHSQNRHQLLL